VRWRFIIPLAPGFLEVVYQRALAIELGKQGLKFVREKSTDIYYAGIRVGYGRVDFFVEEPVMLELKALIILEDAHLAQTLNYCNTFKLPYGLLINFGSRKLEFKRIYNLNHPDSREYKRQ
jgi:GxxExxY protein